VTCVSVLCTVYNAADYLQQAVNSVLKQTFKDWELLITNDGSEDPRVRKILDRVKDPRVTVTHLDTTPKERKASVRYATLFNAMAGDAGGEYLTFLCGDDFYYPDRLKRMVQTMSKGHYVVYGAQKLFREDGTWFHTRPCPGILHAAHYLVDLNSVMVTKEAFDEVGGFPTDPKVWRDADGHLWNRLTRHGFLFYPVLHPERPTDAKRYRNDSVDMRVIRGETPWQSPS
jgi:glycosyltransferase involved in cell wall biosynthesis